MNKPHLLLVDGMALLFRAFFATSVSKQFMINSNGLPTNAVQGYMRHLLTAIEKTDPTHVAVCWDMGSVTFRNEIYSDYKANRTAPPVELLPQFDVAAEITAAFNIPNIGIIGFEADDCIGTICRQNKDQMNITVLTGDRDLLQVLDHGVDVYLLQKGIGNYKQYTKENFIEEYDIHPTQLVDVKALMGDASDGYPGVKGIGEKTALRLIQTYEDIEGLLSNLPKLTAFQRNNIESEIEMLHLSRVLAEVKCDVSLTFNPKKAVWDNIPESGHDFVHQYELKTVRNHIVKTKWFEEAEETIGSGV